MSGVMNPFDTLFGVVISRRSSSRALMLPSFDGDVAARVHAAAGLDDVGADLLLDALACTSGCAGVNRGEPARSSCAARNWSRHCSEQK